MQYIIPARFALIEAAWLKEKPNEAYAHIKWLSELDADCLNTWQTGELLSWSARFSHSNCKENNGSLPQPYALELNGEYAKAAKAWLDLNMPYEAATCLILVDDDSAEQAYIEANSLFGSMQAKSALELLRKRSSQRGFLAKLPRAQRGPYKQARQLD